MILTDELYVKFTEIIYKRTGLSYELNKKYFVQKRIEKRIESLKVEDFKEYYMIIKFSADMSEFDMLVNELTINETYFFRDFPQLQNFAEEVLPYVVKQKKKKKDYTLKIWCAACSTGEEPYTLSIILQEMLEDPKQWDIEILASDINVDVINTAQNGVYENRAVKDVPEEYLDKYFSYRNFKYVVNHAAKKLVSFKRINLSDAAQIKSVKDYDFIFCRNCLIYFDDESRKKVVENFYYSLNSGGHIFLGHSESIGRITSAYNVRKFSNTLVYSKP